MFSLSFFKLRSTYIQGMHRSSVYRLANCYLCMHLCNLTASSWKQESTLWCASGPRMRYTDHECWEEFRRNGAQWTLHKSGSHHKGKRWILMNLDVSLHHLHFAFSGLEMPPPALGSHRIIVSWITFLLPCEEKRGEEKKLREEKWTGLQYFSQFCVQVPECVWVSGHLHRMCVIFGVCWTKT